MAGDLVAWWRKHLWGDLVLGALVTAACAYLLKFADDGGTLYQVVGGSAAALIAFVITPVATLLTLARGARSEAFDKAHRKHITNAMAWAFCLSVALLLGAVFGGAVDSPDNPAIGLRQGLVGAACAAIASAGRLFWFFLAGLSVRQADVEDPLRRAR